MKNYIYASAILLSIALIGCRNTGSTGHTPNTISTKQLATGWLVPRGMTPSVITYNPISNRNYPFDDQIDTVNTNSIQIVQDKIFIDHTRWSDSDDNAMYPFVYRIKQMEYFRDTLITMLFDKELDYDAFERRGKVRWIDIHSGPAVIYPSASLKNDSDSRLVTLRYGDDDFYILRTICKYYVEQSGLPILPPEDQIRTKAFAIDNEFYYAPGQRIEIGNTIGFVSVTLPEGPTSPDPANPIVISDLDNDDRWLIFSPDFSHLEDFDDYHFEEGESFNTWCCNPGYSVLVMRSIAETESEYVVVVNERTGLVKRVSKHPRLQFESIEEHLQHVLLGFDDLNPVRISPSDDAELAVPEDGEYWDYIIHAVEVDGEWIKLYDGIADKTIGWVRWKRDGRFDVFMHYML